MKWFLKEDEILLSFREHETTAAIDDLTGCLDAASISEKDKADDTTLDTVPTKPSPDLQGDTILQLESRIFIYHRETTQFVLWQPDNVAVEIRSTEPFTYWLLIRTKKGQGLLNQPMDNQMNPHFMAQHHSFIWNYADCKNDPCWVIFPIK
jgi:hypothetical protein